MSRRISDGGLRIFHFFDGRWYDEEFVGPLDATTYLDPATGDLYLEVKEGSFDLQHEGETWTERVEEEVCRLEAVISSGGDGPPSWSAYESQLPESVLPLKTRAAKRARNNLLDAPWEAAW